MVYSVVTHQEHTPSLYNRAQHPTSSEQQQLLNSFNTITASVRFDKAQTLQVTNKQTTSRHWPLGIKMGSGSLQSLPSILTCLSINAVLDLGLEGETHQFTTNKQFSKPRILVFTNTHNCLYIWNSQYEVCGNRPCCELHHFRIFPVSYAMTAHNQAVNNPDIQLHCAIKNILNYCCQK